MSGVYFPIAVVRTPDGIEHAITAQSRPQAQEMNLLFTLCEHVNRIMSIDDICRRLKTTTNAVAILACKLRKRLDDNWVIETPKNKGMRIIYVGGPVTEAERTHLVIDFEALKRTRKHSEASKQKMRETAIRNRKGERLEKYQFRRITKA